MAHQWFAQYLLVAGKNLKLKRRSKCGTCVELIFPIVLIGVLIAFIQALLPSISDRVISPLPAPSFFLSRRFLLYTPNNAQTNAIMDEFSRRTLGIPLNDTDRILAFANGAEMEQFYLADDQNIWAGVEFTDLSSNTEYAIRIDFHEIPDTEKLSDNDEGLSGNKDYISTGFLSLQNGIDNALFALQTNQTNTITPTVSQFAFNDPEMWERYLSDASGIFQILGPIFIILALFVSNFSYLAAIVAEKESKIREEMRMMGLLPGVDNWAWFTTVMLFAFIPTIILTLILCPMFYHQSSAATVLFLFFSELVSLYALSILVSLFVQKAKFAGVLGFLVAILMTIIGIVLIQVDTSASAKYVVALFSPAAFVFANYGIIASEKAMQGTDTSNLYTTWRDDTPSVGGMLGFIYLDIFLYIFLAWYIDNVFPGEFGIARPPWFFVTKKYWSDTFGLRDTPHTGLRSSMKPSADVEEESSEMKGRESVVVCGLEKTFQKGLRKKTFRAVDGLDLTMYDNQITAFLGHNGAGKTTTISMLTGLLPVTGGDAYVRGYSIRNQMRQVRQSLGICPQHDVIWPQLTVYDHLYLYAGLKGVPYKAIKTTVDDLIEEIGLGEKRLFQAGSLSGGQKRKLCLAMAFIGGSDVIFLDEPTSGMDPVTRRGVWDFLNNNKQGRTIVLTTHFMDEADFLGDRIAIINHGKLRCAGSSLFLKSRLGVGYLLVMTKNKQCDSHTVDNVVLSNIPNASILAAFGGELSYRLPKEAAGHFPAFFAHLDDNLERLGIDSYGVSVTTLEEVFLRIGLEDKVEREEAEVAGGATNDITTLGQDQEKLRVALAHETQGHRFGQQLYAQLIKRATMYRRDFRGIFFTFLIPLALLIASVAVIGNTGTINIETIPPAPLVVNTSLYATRPYFITGNQGWIVESPLFSSLNLIPREASTFDEYIRQEWKGLAAGAFHLDNLGTNFSTLPTVAAYGIEFNKTLLHVLPAELTFVNNALLRRFTGNSSSIVLVNKPFPHVLSAFELAVSSINTNLMYWSLIIYATFCLIPAGIVASIVQERVLNVKRLLSVSGASRLSYWTSNFLFDWALFLVLVIVCIIIVAGAGKDNFAGDTVGAIFLVLLCYSLFTTTQSYVLSLAFKSYTVVTGAIFIFNFLIGLAFSIAYNIVTFRGIDGEVSKSTVDAVFIVGNIVSPQFGLLATLQRLGGFISLYQKGDTWFTMYLVGLPTLMCIIHFFLWSGILLLIEYKDQISGKFKRDESNPENVRTVSPKLNDKDSDVTAERQRVRLDSAAQNDLVRVIGLRKEYPAPKGGIKVAVKNLTLGIGRGECFGLLGMNGAGKSTTLGALSGDITPTQGEIWLNGYSLLTSPNDALKYFGWCPQFDALIGTLTGREQLTLYARIKGLEERVIPETVEAFLKMLDLTQYASRPVAGYSGGNKRKLSLAVAMIGNPPIVFLDEPSTGMDPLARRYMWNVITALGSNKAVIVTTHSMEECDALSSRIGIMSQGELVCLGTSQHLKSRFASGYSIQLKTQDRHLARVKSHIAMTFPLARVADEHGDLLAYELPKEGGYRLSTIFAQLQALGDCLEDFSVSQTTLEQVFLKLAKEKAEGTKLEVVVEDE